MGKPEEIEEFIRERSAFFWYIPEEKKQKYPLIFLLKPFSIDYLVSSPSHQEIKKFLTELSITPF